MGHQALRSLAIRRDCEIALRSGDLGFMRPRRAIFHVAALLGDMVGDVFRVVPDPPDEG